MQKAEGVAKSIQRKAQGSTTLNRKYVKKPGATINKGEASTSVSIRRSPSISHFSIDPVSNVAPVKSTSLSHSRYNTVQRHPLQTSAINKMQHLQSRQVAAGQQKRSMTAQEIKQQAIQKALADAAANNQSHTIQNDEKEQTKKLGFGFGRIVLALSCATIAVLAIVYFINTNMPDFSLRVAAMQTGISASYPGYVPRGYSVSAITSENKKIVLDFKNNADNSTFTLTEESSSWDSNALLNNYVRGAYGDKYKTIKEQGLTIFVSDSNATWVNGGVVYNITANNGTLTNKQICAIATSL